MPLTINDYRTMLLKIEGVRNAWLNPMTNPEEREWAIPIYADCLGGNLTYASLNPQGDENKPVEIDGLYKVLLEFETDDAVGSLNESLLTYKVSRGPLKGVVLSMDSTNADFISGAIDFSTDFVSVVSVNIIEVLKSMAHEILTNMPLTINDYRTMLLKIEGVRNAWLNPMTNPEEREWAIPIYADCLGGNLTYASLNPQGDENKPVEIDGLYKVLLEFETDDAVGSLNESLLTYKVSRGPLKGVVLSRFSQIAFE